ncbi:response regulator [bacterium]|nr:MAG: response regulator [bacterium]
MSKVRVLLVDDEQAFLELMTERLKSWDYQPLTASTGKDAIFLLQQEYVDIIILDYVMPDMDGFSLIRKIREINNKIPIIMFTAFPDVNSIKEAEREHVRAFIPKTSEFGDMNLSLKAYLDEISRQIAEGK